MNPTSARGAPGFPWTEIRAARGPQRARAPSWDNELARARPRASGSWRAAASVFALSCVALAACRGNAWVGLHWPTR